MLRFNAGATATETGFCSPALQFVQNFLHAPRSHCKA
jgi:hypothetical protein